MERATCWPISGSLQRDGGGKKERGVVSWGGFVFDSWEYGGYDHFVLRPAMWPLQDGSLALRMIG